MKHSQHFFLLFFYFSLASDVLRWPCGQAGARQPATTHSEGEPHPREPPSLLFSWPAMAGWLFHDHFAGLAVDDYSINSALEPQAVPRQEGAVEDNTPVDRINHNG